MKKTEKKCQGVRDIKEQCNNIPKFEVIGLVATFGAALEQKLCPECLEIAKTRYPDGYPMFLQYNEFPLGWRPIGSSEKYIDINGKTLEID